MTFDRPWPWTIVSPWFHGGWMACSALWLFWQYLRSPKRLRAALALHRAAGAVTIALIVVPTQITFQAVKQSFGPVIGFHADRFLHALDVAIHGQEPYRFLLAFIDPSVVKTLDVLYRLWLPALGLFVLWACWTRYRQVRRRAVVAFLLMWIVAGTVVAAAASSGGPCYYANLVAGPDPYADLLDRLDALHATTPVHARAAQQSLWEIRQQDRWKVFGGISAMPSLHVGISVLFALIAWQVSRPAGALLGLYAFLIQIGSVALAWHYAVDGYAGAALAYFIWKTAKWMTSDGADTGAAVTLPEFPSAAAAGRSGVGL